MTTITYIVPRILVAKARKVLQPAEQVRFVTGIKLDDNHIVLTKLLKVRAQRSAVHAAPQPAALARLHNRLLDLGHDIEAQFHSHPGNGPNATYPSPTDLATARRWETGAPFLGAIFSSDGRYVRFFNHEQQSTVQIYGTNYTQLDNLLFELHDPPVPPAAVTPGVTDGPAGTPPVVGPNHDHKE